MPLIVCLSGAIGSGKTVVAASLATRLRIPWVGFGSYVRIVARARGLPDDRSQLQALGESIAAEGWDRFCIAVLTQANWHPGESVVVEGVRHLQALDAIGRVTAPSDVVLVYLDASDATRTARLTATRPAEARGLAHAEQHSTEVQVRESLRSAADVIVDADEQLDAVLDEIVAWCSQRTAVDGER